MANLAKPSLAAFKRHFFEHFVGFSEHGIFHGICMRSKAEKIDTVKGKLMLAWYQIT